MKILLFVLFSTSLWAGPRVVKFETLNTSTRVEPSTANFCITTVSTRAIYQTIRNGRGLRFYSCEVDFAGTTRDGKTSLTGTRSITYRTTPVVLERRRLRNQREYLREQEDEDHMMGYVAIPSSVYSVLPNVSQASEQRRIDQDSYALIPSDQSFQSAVRTACYVAMLESLDAPCSPADLARMRMDVEQKIRELNPRQDQVIHTEGE